jgi:hypothetical protein
MTVMPGQFPGKLQQQRRLAAVPVADFGAARGISLAARHRRTGERLARLLAEAAAAASPDAAVPAEEIG